jgi:hypothetical protein
LGGAGEGYGVRLVRGKPFIAGILGEGGGLERNFSGQELFELAEQRLHFSQFKDMDGLRGSQKQLWERELSQLAVLG